MDYIALLQEKGLGPPILAVYAFFTTLYLSPQHWLYNEYPLAVAGGIAPLAVLCLLVIATVFNDSLMRLLAEETMAETYIQLKLVQGAEKEFYTEYDQETKSIIDDMDERVHKAILTILTGLLISFSVVIISFLKHGTSRFPLVILAALLPLGMLSYPYYQRLHEVIEFAAREATSNNEN